MRASSLSTYARNKLGRSLVQLSLAMPMTIGCATWLPNDHKPSPIVKGFGNSEVSKDSVGIETILLRLDSTQMLRYAELWAQIDEQAVAPELRADLDRNGLRAGKLSGNIPSLLDEWIRANEKRLDEDPLEKTGLASDVSAYSQRWRCRPNLRKELTVRNVASGQACVFYHDGTPKGRNFDAPHFLFGLQTLPYGDSTAKVRLTPEMQYGEYLRKVIASESALRTDNRRESIVWDKLAVELRLNQGDLIVIGPTEAVRGLGEHFFHTRSQTGELQPVLMLAKLTDTRLDDAFAPEESARVVHNAQHH